MNRILATVLILLATGCASVTSIVQRIPGNQHSDDEPIGEVRRSTGSPSVIHGERHYEIGERSKIHVLDVIVTETGETVDLRMQDGTRLFLGERSQLHFHVFSPRRPYPLSRLSLTEGSLRVDPSRAAVRGDARFEISTLMANVILQAETWIGYGEGGGFIEALLLQDGELLVDNQFGQVRIQRKGQGTAVSFGAAPVPARTWTAQQISQIQ